MAIEYRYYIIDIIFFENHHTRFSTHNDDFALVVVVLDDRQRLVLEETEPGRHGVDVVVDAPSGGPTWQQALLQQVLLAVQDEAQVALADLGGKESVGKELSFRGREYVFDSECSRMMHMSHLQI